jgi:hypothetical protein
LCRRVGVDEADTYADDYPEIEFISADDMDCRRTHGVAATLSAGKMENY